MEKGDVRMIQIQHSDCDEKFLTSCDWCGEDICENCGERADWDCPIHGWADVNES
jgi:hypothetical protein